MLISDGKTNILTDGFITRPSIFSLLFTKIKPNKQLIQDTLKKLNLKKIDAIVTLHSHHDHAMDSAEVALQTNALIIASSSTANIAKSQGFHNVKVVSGKQSFQVGNFTLTLIPSLHSKMGKYLARLVGMGEYINEEFKTPSYFTQYKEAQTYSLFVEHEKGNVFINASTNFAKEDLSKYNAHTVFLGTARLSKTSEEFQDKYYKKSSSCLKGQKSHSITLG